MAKNKLTNKNYRIPETTNTEKQPIQTLIVNTLPDATFEMNAPVIYDQQTHTWGSGTHIQITGTLSETEAGKYTVTITPPPRTALGQMAVLPLLLRHGKLRMLNCPLLLGIIIVILAM